MTNGETYDTPQIVTVTDAMSGVKGVTVNDAEVPLTDNQFTSGTADNPQTIVFTDKVGHSYDNSERGYKEADGNAHNCQNCDAHDAVQSHTPGAAATAETSQTCTVCGYIIAPATGTEPGTVTPEVKPGENAPVTNISTPTEELEKMLLTVGRSF